MHTLISSASSLSRLQFVLSWLISDEYGRPTFGQTGDTVSKKPWPWLAEFSYFLDNQVEPTALLRDEPLPICF